MKDFIQWLHEAYGVPFVMTDKIKNLITKLVTVDDLSLSQVKQTLTKKGIPAGNKAVTAVIDELVPSQYRNTTPRSHEVVLQDPQAQQLMQQIEQSSSQSEQANLLRQIYPLLNHGEKRMVNNRIRHKYNWQVSPAAKEILSLAASQDPIETEPTKPLTVANRPEPQPLPTGSASQPNKAPWNAYQFLSTPSDIAPTQASARQPIPPAEVDPKPTYQPIPSHLLQPPNRFAGYDLSSRPEKTQLQKPSEDFCPICGEDISRNYSHRCDPQVLARIDSKNRSVSNKQVALPSEPYVGNKPLTYGRPYYPYYPTANS